MVIMALDHARDFLAIPGLNPTNLATTTVPLFFTRWITHLCAPTFFLLTGTGARLALRRRSTTGLARFLLTRGLWLIFLELVLLRGLAWQINFDYRLTMLVILWALGWAMIILSALIFLPDWLIATFAIALIASHNLFDAVTPATFGRFAPLWTILHVPGFLLNTPRHQIVVAYPLIPWVAVTAMGYALGRTFAWDQNRRRTFLLRLGTGLTLAFIVLRGINRYGDPLPWHPQKSAALTLVSFLNVNKYPPSLLFLLMTLGPAILLLWISDRPTPFFARPILVYGRVPLFYFALHAALLHLLALVICAICYGHIHWIFESPNAGNYPFTPPPSWGLTLPWIYFAWASVVLALYPLCKWFSDLKRRRADPWLSYL
jgi:uncharacterized membrane protein